MQEVDGGRFNKLYTPFLLGPFSIIIINHKSGMAATLYASVSVHLLLLLFMTMSSPNIFCLLPPCPKGGT